MERSGGGRGGGIIRLAKPSDATGIGFVHVRSWQAIYRGHFPQDYLDALDPDQRGEAWRRILEQGYPGERQAMLVAEATGKVVGLA